MKPRRPFLIVNGVPTTKGQCTQLFNEIHGGGRLATSVVFSGMGPGETPSVTVTYAPARKT